MIFFENDNVVLLKNYPDRGLKKGDIGTVRARYETPKEAYDIEFFDKDWNIKTRIVLPPDELKAEMLKYFFECYFNVSADYEELDEMLQRFKNQEIKTYTDQLIAEIQDIIETKNYKKASYYVDKYGMRRMSQHKLEILIQFLYDKLSGNPISMCGKDFYKVK